jgi:SAM-dependent methyltransferase
MHDSVKVTFIQFINNYMTSNDSVKVLEVGSLNVNGGLRDLKPDNFAWHGIDLVDGPGVDQKIDVAELYPFNDDTFDLVVASSVFEHDIEFWSSFLEMCRVLKQDGIILLIMPSQGTFHRYPLDAFRFYPDAGLALEKWANRNNSKVRLIESFTTLPTNEVWADFVAIFSGGIVEISESKYIGSQLGGENWIVDGNLVEHTYQELPIELRRLKQLENRIIELEKNQNPDPKEQLSVKRIVRKVWTRIRHTNLG